MPLPLPQPLPAALPIPLSLHLPSAPSPRLYCVTLCPPALLPNCTKRLAPLVVLGCPFSSLYTPSSLHTFLSTKLPLYTPRSTHLSPFNKPLFSAVFPCSVAFKCELKSVSLAVAATVALATTQPAPCCVAAPDRELSAALQAFVRRQRGSYLAGYEEMGASAAKHSSRQSEFKSQARHTCLPLYLPSPPATSL